MFLRRYERRKRGQGRVYWALVESIRTASGSRQRVVAYLGDVKKRERTGWSELGRRLDRKDRPDPSLFDPPDYPEPLPQPTETDASPRVSSVPRKPRLKITWSRDERWRQWAEASEGCYLLRTNLTGVDPATLWQCYIQLTEAEWAFRITKDELKIRPVWHQKADRVQAHILVCFLAYVLWKTLAHWMKASGLGDAPRTLLMELAKIKSGDVVLPTVTRQGTPGRTVRVRCVTTPDKAQKVLLNRLGLRLPQHLRYLDEVAQM